MYTLLEAIKIPEVVFLTVEIGILVFVFAELVISWLSYKVLMRKKGRPRKGKVEKLMIRLSRQLRESISLNKEDD